MKNQEPLKQYVWETFQNASSSDEATQAVLAGLKYQSRAKLHGKNIKKIWQQDTQTISSAFSTIASAFEGVAGIISDFFKSSDDATQDDFEVTA